MRSIELYHILGGREAVEEEYYKGGDGPFYRSVPPDQFELAVRLSGRPAVLTARRVDVDRARDVGHWQYRLTMLEPVYNGRPFHPDGVGTTDSLSLDRFGVEALAREGVLKSR